MKKLINRNDIITELEKQGYKYFCDEHCRVVSLENLIPLLTYKYFGIDDIWSFWIENKRLYCENIGGMIVAFPLKRKIKY